MDSHQLVLLLLCCVTIDGKEFLKTSPRDIILSEDATGRRPRDKEVALIIFVKNDNFTKAPQPMGIDDNSADSLEVWDPNDSVSTDSDSSDSSSSMEDEDLSEEIYNSTDGEYGYFKYLDNRTRAVRAHKCRLLRNNWNCCLKEGNKICKKACTLIYKNVCATYSCEKKLKKELKTQCKKQCTDAFMKMESEDGKTF